MKAKFQCDCSGHEIILNFDRDKMLSILIRDKSLKKTKYKVKGYLGDVILFDRKSKQLSKFKKFIGRT